MSQSIRDEMRYYAIFQPSAYSTGVKSYRPHTRSSLRESRGAYGPGPANGYGLLATYFAAKQTLTSRSQEAALAAQAEFRAGATYPSAQSLITTSGQWGEPVSTTPTSVESAQYKMASLIYMIAMLPGLSTAVRGNLGGVADSIYADASSWFSVDSSNPESVSAEMGVLLPALKGVAATAIAGGASDTDVSELARYGGAIISHTTSGEVTYRQGLEEDQTLTGQAKDIGGERMEDLTDWACFASRLIGVNKSVCPPEEPGQKAGRYAAYVAGAFILGGLVLYAGRPYVEVVQSFFDGEE